MMSERQYVIERLKLEYCCTCANWIRECAKKVPFTKGEAGDYCPAYKQSRSTMGEDGALTPAMSDLLERLMDIEPV